MKGKIFAIFGTTALLCGAVALSGCASSSAAAFGEFASKGKYLLSYATQALGSADEAKDVVNGHDLTISVTIPLASTEEEGSEGTKTEGVPQALMEEITKRYSGCEITTTYLDQSTDDFTSKTDFIQGSDFVNMLKKNQVEPFSQLIAKNLVIYSGLIDVMEAENARFKESDLAQIAPFKNIFTYCLDEEQNIVIQTRDFVEIASSVGGGVGCSYRQDTEIVYDQYNLMKHWQTSLGVYTSTPNGTLKQGYILEMDINWVEKDG